MNDTQLIEEYAQENDNQRRDIRRLQARIAELEESLRLIRTILERPWLAHIKVREVERYDHLLARMDVGTA